MNALPKRTETKILKFVPSTMESKKVSVDDGFTAIPNELLEAILSSGVLGWKGSYLLATVLKTLKWHKESDWFSHSQVCEMMGIEPSKYHINQLSAAKTELIKAKILFEEGRKIGINLTVFEWSMVVPDKVGSSRKSREIIPENIGSEYPEKVGNTKETITKYKINNTPLPPRESANAEQQAIGSAENIEPKKSKNLPVDYQGVMEEFNLAVADTPISQIRVMSDQRKRAVHALAKLIKKQFGCYTRKAFGDYFQDFVSQVNARADRFYFGGQDGSRWKADFDYLMKAKTFAKTVEGSL